MQAWMPRPDAFIALETNARPLPFSLHVRLRRSRTRLLSGFGRPRPVPLAALDPCEAGPSAVGAEPPAWEGVPLRQGALRLRPRWRAAVRRRAGGRLGRAAAVVAVVLTAACAFGARPSPEETVSLASLEIGKAANGFAQSG